ncbi:MAG: iron ABC transporter permease [Bryobacterales bacterium]|nr:iron ABC transporter permease [Bryobacterales bacterium]
MADTLRSKISRTLALTALLAAVALVVGPLVGGMGLDYGNLLARRDPDWQIFVQLRLPRTLLALLTGAALSVSGALFQALLRDALATPSSLGVSAAASLGAVAAISTSAGETLGFPAVWLFSLLGAAAVVVFIAMLAGANTRFSSFTLLLTGIAVNGICSAAVLLLHSLAGITKSFQITHWLMGGIDAIEYSTLAMLGLIVIPGSLWILLRARSWNVLSYGDEWAAGRGIDTRRLTIEGFVAGALLTGTLTAVTGPIAFVGLIVPHLLRRLVGADHRLLLPASLFGGGAFLVVCDTLSRSVLAPIEVPVGVTTALLGGPFFVWLLWKR